MNKLTIDPNGTLPAWIIVGRRSNGESVFYIERGTQAGGLSIGQSHAERYGDPAEAQAIAERLALRFKGVTWKVEQIVSY